MKKEKEIVVRESNIDETIDKLIREENAQAQAVKTLITAKPREDGVLGTDVETKTDLKEQQTCWHTQGGLINSALEMSPEQFGEKCILGDLIDLKERKLLSLERKSRLEIVEIAKNPEVTSDERKQENLFKKFFTPRK
jgi:hypothetical protein